MVNENTWIEFIRNQELSSIRKNLSDVSIKKILEIGGKDGYLARILTDWGFDVISIDINPSSTYFDVKKMNATELEFKPETFDLVFSSHVIAHIKDKNLLFKEINRVLKSDGLAIHIVPSNWWSVITNFWHYVLLPKILYKKITSKSNSKENLKNDDKDGLNHKKIRLKNLLFLHPLGTERSFIIEIFKFSKKYWAKIFASYGYVVHNESNGPLVYSGYSIFKNHGYKIRKYFAHIFPSSYIFIIKKQNKQSL
ncbi:class I SAM-dependent methyltransferase [Nitrosarchaeum koreense]|uniref:Methyltransferase n=1 Tax=Nitrosarchaeum koreense MY1 TaxID=1001994 RepID=F9CY73_9ARCH|nr:class I SAM-dependent methyltransferase [Nitrosarchaeum koreense]EGP92851.1 Methyltransferase [Nitrosarchaeum koreense MY1]